MKKLTAFIVQLLFVSYATMFSSPSSAEFCGVCNDVYLTCLLSDKSGNTKICDKKKQKCLDNCDGTKSGVDEKNSFSDIAFVVFIAIIAVAALLLFRNYRKKESLNKAQVADDERLWLESADSFWAGVLDLVSRDGLSMSSTGLPMHRLISGDIFFFEGIYWIKRFRSGITLDAKAAGKVGASQIGKCSGVPVYKYEIDKNATVFKANANNIPADKLVDFGNSWRLSSGKDLPSSIEEVIGSLANSTKESKIVKKRIDKKEE